MLDQQAITEFKKLYLKEYGVQLTDEQALDYGKRLVGLVKAVYGNNLPKPKNIDNNEDEEHD